ncbi:uncharacterized protein DSM5745_06573 [Aspergillus mulundensis]|uniref:FAD/NAD(P)-binding domain-containing protein n=1 Tax=Aspergillus mulundensis TaxID=1810919 RepID=A0A3D8RRZ6_9EURO|nr:Uncharacterized protein DSM5745_06573 [Aspergillus mulundensis]RDW76581.1 Uncharacterized protein DSM5745_06573 [Aspergillus mulundensis]
MARPKRVAIIGAGPSGLVTAKTLLLNFPSGTFEPVVFEKKNRIGGLWAVDYPSGPRVSSASEDIGWDSTPLDSSDPSPDGAGRYGRRALVDPWMRTNLSRFSVAFSDFSWETALGGGVPDFPCAWEVRKYLEEYARTYIPTECLRLGTRVSSVRRANGAGVKGWAGWEMTWIDDGEDEGPLISDSEGPSVRKEEFDFLVVASGHFGTPNIPHVPRLEYPIHTVHSSELQGPEDIYRLLERPPKRGKLVVVGGSMSGIEAAASLALHLSSIKVSPRSPAQKHEYEVWHISTGPFWVLPTYLPHQYAKHLEGDTIPFVPLDLSLYDLDSRPPGMTGVAFGPISQEQTRKRNIVFRNMLGEDYAKVGSVHQTNNQGVENNRPPWVGISDQYAEFVRSGAINITTGRACSVTSEAGSGTVNIETSAGTTCLTEVASIVMATGFKPSESLSFLPQDVLSTLEYCKEDHFLPLVLDSMSSAHSAIPDLGFAGFYRGAFWGPAEFHAQSLAQAWAAVDLESEVPISLSEKEENERAAERQRVRDFRNFRPTALRGQFPFGDYVGLMEAFACRLERPRLPLEIWSNMSEQPAGPVVPVRYAPIDFGTNFEGSKSYPARNEVKTTMKALNSTLAPEPSRASVGTVAAIFRAWHGQWIFERVVTSEGGEEVRSSGKTTYHPRYPSSPGYEAEYLCEELAHNEPTKTIKLVYRLCDTSRSPRQRGIRIWSVDEGSSPNSAAELTLELQVGPVGRVMQSGEILVTAEASTESGMEQHTFEFLFQCVSITSWRHDVLFTREGTEVQRTTRYSRQQES